MKTIYLIFFVFILSLSACVNKIDMAKYALTKEDSTKLDLTSYPEVRKEVMALRRADTPDKAFSKPRTTECTDDNVAVGPEGMRSIGFEKWKKGFEKDAVKFKKVEFIPNSEIIRIYNEGKTAVLNYVVHVTLETPAGEFSLNVCRLETFIKKGEQWCMVAGQGTEPVDYGDVFKTQVIRILGAFLVGGFLMFFIMWRKLKRIVKQ
ncbi:MAG: hypothetical protein V4585_03300 [Bacteroidota bacterium]